MPPANPTTSASEGGPETRRVRYVGRSQRGRIVGATGQLVRPADSKAPLPKGDDGKPVEVPSEVDVPAAVAVSLVRQRDWEPVGWTPEPPKAADDNDGDAGEGDDAGDTEETPSAPDRGGRVPPSTRSAGDVGGDDDRTKEKP